MKYLSRSFCIFLIALLSGCILSSCSPKSEETETNTETTVVTADFYKTIDENKVLSIELDTDPASGYYWTYEISDEEILNLTSFGFNPGNEEGEGALWNATFASPSGKSGSVQLSFYSVQELEDVAQTEPSYVMDLDIAVDGKITVKSITQ